MVRYDMSRAAGSASVCGPMARTTSPASPYIAASELVVNELDELDELDELSVSPLPSSFAFTSSTSSRTARAQNALCSQSITRDRAVSDEFRGVPHRCIVC